MTDETARRISELRRKMVLASDTTEAQMLGWLAEFEDRIRAEGYRAGEQTALELREALDELLMAADRFAPIFATVHPGEMTEDEMHSIAQNAYFGEQHANAAHSRLTATSSPTVAGERLEPTPRWALWDFEAEKWDEVPAENAPGEWLGGHDYGAAHPDAGDVAEPESWVIRVERGGVETTYTANGANAPAAVKSLADTLSRATDTAEGETAP